MTLFFLGALFGGVLGVLVTAGVFYVSFMREIANWLNW